MCTEFPSSQVPQYLIYFLFPQYLFCLSLVIISQLTSLRENNLDALLQKCFLILTTPVSDCPSETLRNGESGEGRKAEL